MKKYVKRGPRKPCETVLPDELRKLAVKMVAVRKRADALGIYLGDRELLQCPACGLMENVDFYGRLFTCRESDLDKDCGLQFEALAEGRWRCPACEAVVEEKER